MADKRMFSLKVIDDDRFLELPLAAQTLYFQFCMRADDEGFLNGVKRLRRSLVLTDDDEQAARDQKALEDGYKALVDSGYILAFESGVICITHWKQHNSIRPDRLEQSIFPERNLVRENKSKIYERVTTLENTEVDNMTDNLRTNDGQSADKCPSSDGQVAANCQTSDGQVTANCPHRLDKDSIGEDRLDKNSTVEDRIGQCRIDSFNNNDERDIKGAAELSTIDDWSPPPSTYNKTIPIRREGYA